MTTKEKNEKWTLLESSVAFKAEPWVKVFKDKVCLPGGRIVDDYYRIELPEYAMVYAVSNDGKILIEKIYKHAIGDVSLVLPTGCVETEEVPLDTAKRELLEETGYEAGRWSFMGTFVVDGNKGSGRGHFFVAEDLCKIKEPVEDDMENAEILFMEPEDVMQALLSSDMSELATTALIALATNSYVKQITKERNKQ